MQMFTQCACVLFEAAPTLEELERALDGWDVAGPQPAAPGEGGWAACGPGFVIELRGGGSVIVDVVDHRWPDDPRAPAAAPTLVTAWEEGMFGPSAAPGALARARQQAWSWEGARAAADRHGAFLRLRSVVELSEDAPELPADHDPLHELGTLTEMAGGLLRMRGAVALFMPGGEALRSRDQVEEVLRRKTGIGPPPIDLWVNLRAVALGEKNEERWLLLDLVGMNQLRLPDQEALLPAAREDRSDAVAALLRNASLHLVAGRAIPPGATSDDPTGQRWKASAARGLLAPANRPVLRWLAEGSPAPSEAMLARYRPPGQ